MKIGREDGGDLKMRREGGAREEVEGKC